MLTAIRALFVYLLTNVGLRTLAFKYFLKGLIFIFVPLAIFAGFNLVLSAVLSYVQSQLESISLTGFSGYSMTGVAAYLYTELGLNIGFPMVVSSYAIRFTMRCIPFLHL